MGILAETKSIMYRAARKFVIVNKSQFFALDGLSDVVCSSDLTKRFQFVSFDDTDRMSARVGAFVGESLLYLLDGKNAICTVAIEDNHPIAFAWWAFGEIPAELNHDGHPLTGLPLQMPPDMAYLFNVFVRPEYRGQRLYPNLVRHSERALNEKDICRITLATEYTNRPALRSVERMGFYPIGNSRLVNLCGWSWANYPESPMKNGVQIGRYVGDTQRTPMGTRT
jgi:ribosomal protein S18 acetylase RimI-like enzyme